MLSPTATVEVSTVVHCARPRYKSEVSMSAAGLQRTRAHTLHGRSGNRTDCEHVDHERDDGCERLHDELLSV